MLENRVSWPGWITGNRIGKGGFGSVYEIYRNEYGILEKAALKVISIPHSEEEIDFLRGEGMDDKSITTQFNGHVNDIVREYKMMIGLKNCPNVVRCEDYMVVKFNEGLGWDVYLKMELLTPLLKALDQVSTESQIIKLGVDLCNALVFCQKKAIIHRDIKPQNIFVDEDGNFKLGDFGIARMAQKTTRATVGIGTYNFMAPEVLNNRPYGPSVDIYSLGLVLYWLLNKRRGPFLPLPPVSYTTSMDDAAKRRRFGGEALPAPVNGSPSLKRIVLKACAFEPKDRYSSALEMKRDLEALSGGTATMVTYWNSNATVRNNADRATTVRDRGFDQDNYTVWENHSEKVSATKKIERTNNVLEKRAESGAGFDKRSKWMIPAIIAAVLAVGVLIGSILSAAGVPGSEKTEKDQSQIQSQTAPRDEQTSIVAPTTEQTQPATAETTAPTLETVAPVIVERVYIAVDGGLDHTVVLFNDGTVEAIGSNNYGQCDVRGWSDIIQISTLRNHTVGLKADGTVVAVGENKDGQCNVGDWTDIVAVSAGEHHTVGLKSDGTVVSVGRNQSGECEVMGWRDIVAIGTAYTNTVGLCSDGTVIVSGSYTKGKIPGWEGVEQISVSDAHIVGLFADGTVKAVGNNNHKQCDLNDWNNIVAISAGCAYTTGLRADGTVLVKGVNDVGQHGAMQWSDIVYIATGLEHTIGIKTDGTFIAVGANDKGQCNVSQFSDTQFYFHSNGA